MKGDRTSSKRKILAEFIEESGKGICMRTFDRYANKLGLRRRPATKSQVLGKRHRIARIQWVRTRINLTINDFWSRIIFCDECTIRVGQRNRIYVFKQDGEGRHRPDVYGGIIAKKLLRYQINVWGAIIWFGQGILKILHGTINAEVYINILDECLWPIVAKYFLEREFIFQEDNAHIRKAKKVQEQQ